MSTKTIALQLTKTSLFIFALVLTFIILALPSKTFAQTNSVTITSPNGGESYTEGDSVQINWTTTSNANCSLYYQTEAAGPFTSYYVGNVADASVGTFNWTASVPSGSTTVQQEKIQMVCTGMPAEYSDNYFSVTPVSTPPTCDAPVQLSLQSQFDSSNRNGTVYNTLFVTNPNDASCGPKLYGISKSYPGGWTMNAPFSVTVNPGSTESVPFDLTVPSDAAYQSYQYSLYAGGSEGGNLVGVDGTVFVDPVCNLPVQASLSSTPQNAYAGDTLSNNLVLTNPNLPECSAKMYVYSRSYPQGWNMTIQPNVTVNSGQTVSVPFTLAVAPTAPVGTQNYDFWVYNAWYDGAPQTQLSGTVNVLEHIAPTVTVTNPLNNAKVARNRNITIRATAADNVGVTKVEFYVNNVLKCTDTTSAYTCVFLTANQSGVVYTLTAKAYDAANNTSTSTVTVTTK